MNALILRRITVLTLVCLALPLNFSLPVNILSVQDPGIYGSKPGYIDEASLVVEPHGSHVEQSLYLKYSDHSQFNTGKQIEIVHRFELPEGTVINDLWLWIGDSVMQAIMMDTWSARAIYDSIVNVKRDPAFLSKNGNQYELHVYPLTPGSYRKIKLNFITPTRWIGQQASTALPVKMLLANNAPVKPLNILFRTQGEIWGTPSISEITAITFSALPDTMAYHFKYCRIEDLSTFDNLTLNYQPYFTDGLFYQANQFKNEPIYYQLGLLLDDLFLLPADTSAKKYLIGFDLSGLHNRNLNILTPKIKTVLNAAMKEGDLFNIFAVGAGDSLAVSADWLPYSKESVDAVFQEIGQSDFAKQLAEVKLPHIIYTDGNAATCWRFPGIDNMASWEQFAGIQQAKYRFQNADIIAAYNHGFEDPQSTDQLNMLLAPIDSFFVKGGRLLSFYDYNRVGTERLATHFIPGLTRRKQISGTLYRNPQGHIGMYFPESVHHHVINLLTYNDPDVKIELMDKDGNPAVISKKIRNGLLVVSGLWAFKDDAALRALLGVPLLGLNAVSRHHQLNQLLYKVRSHCSDDPFDKAIIFSNSDSLIGKEDALDWATDYINGFSAYRKPLMHSLNLLDGSSVVPPYLSDMDTDYYGSGYMLKMISDLTSGIHFETHATDWNYISAILSPNTTPIHESLQITGTVDHGADDLSEIREIGSNIKDANKPIFFIGMAQGIDQLTFNIDTRFAGLDQTFEKTIEIPVSHDTTQKGRIVSSMLGYERLKELLYYTSYDTVGIVQAAMKYNLLCDYTALIALEPNETLHFMKNPFDESKLPATLVLQEQITADSVYLDIYPNPFNEETTILINVPEMAHLSVAIYNIRGQMVKQLEDEAVLPGKKRLLWNATNEYGARISSGIYFVRLDLQENNTKSKYVLVKNIVYLK